MQYLFECHFNLNQHHITPKINHLMLIIFITSEKEMDRYLS